MSKRLSIQERENMRSKALKDITLIDNYPKQFDVTVYFWTEAKSAEEAKEKVEGELRNCGITTSFGEIEEVEY